MHLPLPADQLRHLLHHVQHSIDCTVPIGEQDLFVFDGREVNNSINPVYPALDGSCIIKDAELVLA